MADISNGSLSFTSTMDNEQMNAAIDETLRRIQGLSDGTVDGTMAMAESFEKTAQGIRQALGEVGAACEQHESALASLEEEYSRLKAEQGKAFMEGRDSDVQAIQKSIDGVKGEMVVRQKLLNELRQTSDELEQHAAALERDANAAEGAENAHKSLRTRMREVREEMADMVLNGIDEQSEAYVRLRDELGMLTDLQGDIQAQANQLGNDEAQFAGAISGINGVMGAMSAAAGAAALFGEENEELQKTMMKLQALMSITTGMQQVAQTLNKDSAFMITTLGGLKEWWAKIVATATAAQTAQTGAAVAGTAANITLAGAFRAVGVAIKSIPAFGWILAGISALIGLVAMFVGKANEAEKAAKEWYQSIADNAYKPIAAIEELAVKWNALGDDFNAKKEFIEANKKVFDELGVAVNGVTDAENLLIANKDAFINAQIEKAKAMILLQQTQEKVKTLLEKEQEYNAMPNMVTKNVMTGVIPGSEAPVYERIAVVNDAKTELKAEIDDLRKEITQGFTNAANAETEGFNLLKQAGINAANTYADGTVGAIEQAISDKQAALKNISDPTQYKAALKEIEGLQKRLQSITGGGTTTKTTPTSTGANKDPFLEKLNKYKTEYERFYKWLNSGDEILVQSANQEFAGLLQEGANYIDFLRKQRDEILAIDESQRTAEQVKNLSTINQAIADETKQTVMESFNAELEAQLASCKTIAEMLDVIEQRRKELDNDGTELDNEKAETLNERETTIKTDAKNEYSQMLTEYGTFEQRKLALAEDFAKKRAIAQANGDEEMLAQLESKYKEALSGMALDDMMASPDWELMFGDLDELTNEKLNELLRKVDGMTAYLGVEFSPEDLAKLKEAIGNMKAEIQERNPFKALKDSFSDYSKAVDSDSKKKALTNMMTAASGACDIVTAGMKGVIDIMSAMGVEADSEAAVIANDLMKIGESAGQLAQGIATGNPISIIQGSVGILTAAFDLFNFKDRAAERRIKKHQEALKQMQSEYEQLAWAIDKALGSDVYSGQMDAIHNMEGQIDHLKASIREEDDKKKTDHDRIKEWQDQIAELERNIADMYDEIAKDILQTDGKDFANQLGDALAEAFRTGEDAALAFENTVNEVLRNAIVNQLKKNFLEKQLQGVLDDLYNSMGYWEGDNFHFDGLTGDEIASFKNRVNNIAQTYNQALEQYGDIFKDIVGEDDPSSLAGAVKGVTEETAEIIAGQMQAIRINQAENTALMNRAIESLAIIASNTAFNRNLAKIDRIIALLENESSDAALRGNGIQI